jgi:hypothetical protein
MATFKALQDNVLAMLKVSDTGTRTRVKVAINQAVKELSQVRDWTFLADVDNTVAGAGSRTVSLAAYTDFDKVLMIRIGTSADNAMPIRRRNRLTVAYTKSSYVEISRYAVATANSLTLDYAMAVGQTAYVDYKKLVVDMSADVDVCVIPDSWTYIVEQLAFARILKIDDDTRATSERQLAMGQISLMIKQCPYYDPMFDTDDCMAVGGYLDQ